jgi:putative phosphoribosyl transferase
MSEALLSVPAGKARLEARLELPDAPLGLVLFSRGGASHHDIERDAVVSRNFRGAGLGTLWFDLLTANDKQPARLRMDVELLTARLGHAVRFASDHVTTRALPVGLFGASTGTASALRIAAEMPDAIRAVVSLGGRPDMAGTSLATVRAPTLLIAGGGDYPAIGLNKSARDALVLCERKLAVVPGATHVFEDPTALEEVGLLAADWFVRYLAPAPEERTI